MKAHLKKIGASVAAALTTPEAVKFEKSVTIVALTRAAILVPSAAWIIKAAVEALAGG